MYGEDAGCHFCIVVGVILLLHGLLLVAVVVVNGVPGIAHVVVGLPLGCYGCYMWCGYVSALSLMLVVYGFVGRVTIVAVVVVVDVLSLLYFSML